MSIYDYIVIAFYLAFMLLLGPVFKRFSKTASDFFRGGGGMLWWIVGSSTFVSTFTAWSFTGGAAKTYETGTFFLLLFICNFLALIFTYFLTAARFRQMRVITATEAIRKRFGNFNEQVFSWIPIFSIIVLGGIYLYTISVFMYSVFGINMMVLIIALGITVTVMTLLGGSWAATAGDFIQMLIILTITLVMTYLALKHPDIGGVSGLVDKLPEKYFNWTLFDRPWILVFFALTLLTNQLVQNNSMSTTGGAKYVFVKDGSDAKKSSLISLFGYLILPWTWMVPALAAVILHPDLASEYPKLNNPHEAAYVAMAITLLPKGLLGLLVCAIFAATLTTLNSYLNISAGIFVRNFYIRMINKNSSEKRQISVGQIFIFLNGVIWIFAAVYFNSLKSIPLFDLLLIAAASIGIPLTIPLFFGIFVKKTPSWSAWSTMVIGFTFSILLRFILTPDFFNSVFSPATPFSTQEINDLNIATTTGVLIFICVSWFFGTMLFYKKERKEYIKQVSDFFIEINTPVDRAKEHGPDEDNDRKQYLVMGYLSIIYGCFDLLLLLIQNTLKARLCILFCGGVIVLIGLVLVIIGRRIKKTQLISGKPT